MRLKRKHERSVYGQISLFKKNSLRMAYITAVCRWPAVPVHFEIINCALNLRET